MCVPVKDQGRWGRARDVDMTPERWSVVRLTRGRGTVPEVSEEVDVQTLDFESTVEYLDT